MNVVIASVLFVFLVGLSIVQELFQVELLRGHLLARLMWVNLFLVGFNLLPAFPMDGGRVLRALLATRLGRRRARAIAANIGQGMAILFAIFGFFHNPFLIFIAVFVYLGAQIEAAQVELQSALEGLRVRDAMMTRFRTLSAEQTLEDGMHELLAGSQQDFPVVSGDAMVGVLMRKDLVKALDSEGRQDSVASDVLQKCGTTELGARP